MRAIKIVLAIGFLLTVWFIGMGGLILIKFHDSSQSIPFWQFGQQMLFMGILYFCLLIALWALIEKWNGKK